MIYMIKYHPYKVINQIKSVTLLQMVIKVYIWAAGMSDSTIYKDKARKQ